MGRGRGKGKKLTAVSHEDGGGSSEEERIPVQKRRGRPQRPLKDSVINKGEVENIIGDKNKMEETKDVKEMNDVNMSLPVENGRKRKKNSQAKEKPRSPIKDENNGIGLTNNNNNTSNGFRHIGSRRKSKPRRAAEVGVECN